MAKQSKIFLAVTSTGYNKYKDQVTGFSTLEKGHLDAFSDPDEALCLQKLYASLQGKTVITFDGGQRLAPFLSWRDRQHKLGLNWKQISFADQKTQLMALRPFHPSIHMRSKAFAEAIEAGNLQTADLDQGQLAKEGMTGDLAQSLLIQAYLESLSQKLSFTLEKPRSLIGQVYHTERLADGVFLRLKTDAPSRVLFLQTDTYRVEGDLADMEVTLFARPVQTESGQGLAYVVQAETRDYVLIADGQKLLLNDLMDSVKKTLVHMMSQISL